MSVTLICPGCGVAHRFPDAAEAEQVWCHACGRLIVGRGPSPSPAAVLASREAAAPLPRGVFRIPAKPRKPRPISVLVALVAGGLAVFLDVLASYAMYYALGGPGASRPFLISAFFFLLVWIGLMLGSRMAWRVTRVGAIVAAVLTCNATLWYQVHNWETHSEASDIVWGLLRMILQTVPLLIVFLALGTRSAREFYKMVCPDCGSAAPVFSGRFVFRARCPNCDRVW